MKWRAIVAAAVLVGMATGTSAQKGPDAEKFAAGALREEAKRLGGQLGCYRMLYFLPSDRTDQARLDLFRKATDALEADFSDRVDAHVARFSAPTPVYLRKPLLRMFTWRDIWAVITPEMDRVPFQHPTDADVSSCWMIAAGALDIARENGLLGAETPARRAK